MVDGVGVGGGVTVYNFKNCPSGCSLESKNACSSCEDREKKIWQDFKDADLVVVESNPLSRKKYEQQKRKI